MAEFLLELLSEEIPARMQACAADDLKRLVCQGLEEAGLTWTDARAFVTPRRLALVIDGLPEKQPDMREERKGPRVGAPEKAVQGFLRAAGLLSIDEAEVRETNKGSFYFAVELTAGTHTVGVLGSVVPEAMVALPWPKAMRWGTTDARWVRPLHNILAVFKGQPVRIDFQLIRNIDALAEPTSETRLQSDALNRTIGHRFLAPDRVAVTDFANYREKLREANVILDQDERRRLIAAEAARLAAAEGLAVRDDPALLDEVTGLVEWPVVHLGRIDAAFMDVPPEVLIAAMRTHQKYFALTTADGALAPRFVLVANTETKDGGRAIIAGNERVLRARLSDAKYFWDQDRKLKLEDRVSKLKERVFHTKLGSDFERTERLQRLARHLAALVTPPSLMTSPNPGFAQTAARLCKADLMTQMVGEFPELQGVMGRYYALHGGERPEVADAIRDHYAPQGPNDCCPTAPVSIAVALADKIDMLVGFFAVGEKPTGSKDPFALRRAALGVIRIIIENAMRLNLSELFKISFALYVEPSDATVQLYRSVLVQLGHHVVGTTDASLQQLRAIDHQQLADDLLAFFADRLKVHLREQGVRHDLIAAVFAGGGEDDIVRLLARVDALRDFLDTDDGANLLTAYRRASNIVRIEEAKDGAVYAGEADPRLLSEEREAELHQRLSEARGRIKKALDADRFREAMAILAGLRPPVDAFFDHVRVNCEDPHLRANRLRLLAEIRSALGGVADFSQIEG